MGSVEDPSPQGQPSVAADPPMTEPSVDALEEQRNRLVGGSVQIRAVQVGAT